MSVPHLLHVVYESGYFQCHVECPNENLGKTRPCAVWADSNGTAFEDECTFQQYADATDLEEWLGGTITFPAVPIVSVGDGDTWRAEVAS